MKRLLAERECERYQKNQIWHCDAVVLEHLTRRVRRDSLLYVNYEDTVLYDNFSHWLLLYMLLEVEKQLRLRWFA